MPVTITNAGWNVINNHGTGGPYVNLTRFKVLELSPANYASYTPSVTDTESYLTTTLGGVIHYTGQITNYYPVSDTEIRYTCPMGVSIGTFDYNVLLIEQEDPNNPGSFSLFGIYKMPATTTKTATSGPIIGDSQNLNVRFVEATMVAAVNINVLNITDAKFVQLGDVDLLPIPSLAATNTYHCTEEGDLLSGGSVLAIVDGTTASTWNFVNAKVLGQFEVASATATSLVYTNSVYAENFAQDPVASNATSKFFIQFMTGAHQGVVRRLESVNQSLMELTWFTSTASAPLAGEVVRIYCTDTHYQKNYGVENELTSVNDVAILDKNAIDDARMYRVTRQRPGLGVGSHTFGLYNTFAVTGQNEWIPSEHGLIYDVDNLPTVSDPTGNPSAWVNDSTHIVVAVPFNTPAYSDSIPARVSDIVLTIFSDTCAGYITEVANVEVIDDGVTEWIRFTLDTPLPATPTLGTPFKVYYPNVLGGSGGGGGTPRGLFRVETYTAGPGGETNWTTANVNVNYCLVFWGSTFQDPSTYTVNTPTSITTSFVVPENEKIHFVEITAAPIPGAGIDVGVVVPFPVNGPFPAGWLPLEGDEYPEASYPELSNFLGGLYNNGTETPGYFRVPDYRGVGLRGLDSGRGLDVSVVYGNTTAGNNTVTSVNYNNHIHLKVGMSVIGTGIPIGTTVTSIGPTTFQMSQNATLTNTGVLIKFVGRDIGTLELDTSNSLVQFRTEAVSSSVTQTVTVPLDGEWSDRALTCNNSGTGSDFQIRMRKEGGETRGANASVVWCIRAYANITNGGLADVSSIQTELTNFKNEFEIESYRIRMGNYVMAFGYFYKKRISATDVINFGSLVVFNNLNYNIQVTRGSRPNLSLRLADVPRIRNKTVTSFTLDYGPVTGPDWSYYWEVKGEGSFT